MKIKETAGFKYIETREGRPVLLLLHGLFGALSNFQELIEAFEVDYNVVVPLLPIYELDLDKTGLDGLLVYVKEFVEHKNFSDLNLLGNSLGGHIAQLLALDCPDKVASMTLTGSSGLFESGMGDGYPRRGDKDYIARKVAETFYDPAVASENLIDEVFETVNDRNKAIRIVVTAKTALKHNLGDDLHNIKCPTLLVWGKEDTITPPFVGEKFHELIPHSELHFLEECGHAPMMERPKEFNIILKSFLRRIA
ncbi:MAG: 2-hydroxy-6-oxonona-2,4-dienedioate hydrolase [Saprospiraceae bacterium]